MDHTATTTRSLTAGRSLSASHLVLALLLAAAVLLLAVASPRLATTTAPDQPVRAILNMNVGTSEAGPLLGVGWGVG